MAVDYLKIIIPTQSELLEALADWYKSSGLLALGILGYALVLAVSLREIDRRDWLAGFTYAGFCAAAGVLLILVIPHRLDDERGRGHLLLTTIAITALAIWRWYQGPTLVIREPKTGTSTQK